MFWINTTSELLINPHNLVSCFSLLSNLDHFHHQSHYQNHIHSPSCFHQNQLVYYFHLLDLLLYFQDLLLPSVEELSHTATQILGLFKAIHTTLNFLEKKIAGYNWAFFKMFV